MKKYLFPLLLGLMFMACSKDSDSKDEPLNSDGDPEGTVTVHMKNVNKGGKTYKLLYGYFGITEWNSFGYGIDDSFSDEKHVVRVGKVKNLSAIKEIPANGWVSDEDVRAGYGYIIKYVDEESNKHYVRVYVVSFESDAEDNIIDALVKYQDDWETWDENNDEPELEPSVEPSVDPSEDPEPSIDPSEEDDLADAEALLADKYFWGSTPDLGEGGDFQFYFQKDHKVTISAENEVPWTIEWTINKERHITFKRSTSDPNKLYGVFVGDIVYSGKVLTIQGTDANNGRYELVLNLVSAARDKIVLNNISGRVFTANGAWNNQAESDMTLNFISTSTAYIQHAGECPYRFSFIINDIFLQQVSEGQWNGTATATNASEKLSGSYVQSWAKGYTYEELYGKIEGITFDVNGEYVWVKFSKNFPGKNGLVTFRRN